MTEMQQANVKLQEQAIAEVRRRLVGCFRYIDLETAEPLYLIPTGFSGWVCVIGHPDHGAYEWVARGDVEYEGQPDVFYDHSDCGYGSGAAAMRDGLARMVDT